MQLRSLASANKSAASRLNSAGLQHLPDFLFTLIPPDRSADSGAASPDLPEKPKEERAPVQSGSSSAPGAIVPCLPDAHPSAGTEWKYDFRQRYT